MNFIDQIKSGQGEAQLRYLDGEYQIMKTGVFVRCGVTGDPIPINSLRYWNVDKQIAYASAKVAFHDIYGELSR